MINKGDQTANYLTNQANKLITGMGSPQDYCKKRNCFITSCLANRTFRAVVVVLPIILTAVWYCALDIYRYFCPDEKIKTSIVLQNDDSYFIGVTMVAFIMIALLGATISMYFVSELIERRSNKKLMVSNLGLSSKLWILVNAVLSTVLLVTIVAIITSNRSNIVDSRAFALPTMMVLVCFWHTYLLVPKKEALRFIVFALGVFGFLLGIVTGYCCRFFNDDYAASFCFVIFLITLYMVFNILWFCCVGIVFIAKRVQSINMPISISLSLDNNCKIEKVKPFKRYIMFDVGVLFFAVALEFYLIVHLMLIIFKAIDTYAAGIVEALFFQGYFLGL